MPPRKVFETPEQAAEYLEVLRRRNRERAKYFYDNKIKTDPEKYKQFLEKCKKPSNDYYHKNKNLTVEI
jgi:preprotein translocase subunit Sss1